MTTATLTNDRPACRGIPEEVPPEGVLYGIYNRGGSPDTAGLNYKNEPCPAWHDLPPNVKAKWANLLCELAEASRLTASVLEGIADYALVEAADPALAAEESARRVRLAGALDTVALSLPTL